MGEPADKRVEGLVPIYVNLTHNTFQLQDCFLYRLQVSCCSLRLVGGKDSSLGVLTTSGRMGHLLVLAFLILKMKYWQGSAV